MSDTIIERCEAKGFMTEQRRIIADVLEDSEDHPDVGPIFARLRKNNHFTGHRLSHSQTF